MRRNGPSRRRATLAGWYGFHAGYDPLFTWWAERPYAAADSAIAAHIDAIREDVVGIRGDGIDPIIGDPIGEAGLRAHLAHEMIPYTAADLIAIGEAELAWCEARLLEASREMGFGDDWKGAQEAVKERAVPPGGKPRVVHDLAAQSVAFIEERDRAPRADPRPPPAGVHERALQRASESVHDAVLAGGLGAVLGARAVG